MAATPPMIASSHTNHPLAPLLTDSGATPLQRACLRLKTAGLRITQPRIAILEALIRRSLPASIEQIHADLQTASGASCDLVTVYRCLAAFEQLGLVRRCFFHNGTSLYQLSLDDSPTYHVVDKDANAVAPLDADLADELRSALRRIEEKLALRGYENVSHMVEFFGRTQQNAVPDRTQAPLQMPAAG
jgi:Fur family transcriptional regulator, ferric uptake regulator